ncbi:aldehyde dehydrogenase family protein [Acidipropionibacterium virtanenii]|uniref:Succinate-semialdehyde dehydrogenase [NADP(+)] 1 n=1 Tax=Acidipropionibacterium virtanenii TaxID=2057246 RepID=A0A344UQ52_9ACTN|nr:aldehyde dehydrogenase family protein [Acidipropionibacterium virtanenii]AXE37400.1 Succinate-semialdehyde dehydrogenase [NADP(+)] 1 [Acidipropionibacterium virtanenii]
MAYATTNPYTGEAVKEFPTATAEQIDGAIEKADATFRQWRTTSPRRRADLLQKAADLLRTDHRHYAEVLTREMGKLISEAEAEVEVTAQIFEYYARHGAQLLAPRYIKAEGYGDTDVALVNDPMGIIYTVEPWNFPYYQIVRTTAPLVTDGNVVLLKQASIVPQAAAEFQDLMLRAGAPEGLFTNIYASHDASEQILGDPRVRGVALTGSEGAGASIAAIAAKNLKKSTLELGGSDAFVVLDDADVAKAADWAVLGRHWNAGQVCTSSKRLIVVDSVYDEFLEHYRKGVAGLVAGDPMDPATTLAPLSSQQAADALAEQVEAARDEGVTVETIGAPVPEQGAFVRPVLLTDIPEGSETARTEFFGPVTQLYRAADEEDAVRIANASPFGLGGSVFSSDIARAQDVARRMDTGMVFINQPTGVAPDIPFGGVKRSGYGRELLDLGLKEFVNQKVVAVADIDGSFF